MRYITVTHGIQSTSIQVTDGSTTAASILSNPIVSAQLGIGGNSRLVDQDGNDVHTINSSVTSLQVANQGSTKG